MDQKVNQFVVEVGGSDARRYERDRVSVAAFGPGRSGGFDEWEYSVESPSVSVHVGATGRRREEGVSIAVKNGRLTIKRLIGQLPDGEHWEVLYEVEIAEPQVSFIVNKHW